MHRLARSLATAGCSSTRAARLAESSWRAAATSPPRLLATASRRNIHVRVPLPYKIEDGMGDFLPPAALKVIAEDYQQGLLDRLNEQIKGLFLLLLLTPLRGLVTDGYVRRGVDRHQARKSERRTDRHLDRATREPDARIQLREPRAQQQFLPPPPRTCPTTPPTSPPKKMPRHSHSHLFRNRQRAPPRTMNPR